MATGSGSSWSGNFQTTLPTVFGSSVICQCPEPYRQGFSCRRQTWCRHHRSPDLDDCTGGRVGYPIPFLNRATLLLGVLPLTYLLLLVVAVRVCCPWEVVAGRFAWTNRLMTISVAVVPCTSRLCRLAPGRQAGLVVATSWGSGARVLRHPDREPTRPDSGPPAKVSTRDQGVPSNYPKAGRLG